MAVSFNIDLLSIGLTFVIFILIGVLAFFFKDIKNGWFKKQYKKKGFGLVGIVQRNNKVRYFWKKFTDEIPIKGEGTFLFNKKFVVEQDGIHTIYYYAGNAKPINLIQERGALDMCPEMFAYAIEKSKASGSVSKGKGQDLMFYVTIGGAIAAVITLLLVFNATTDIGTIKAMVQTLLKR